jgi:hypothetical protein
MANIRTLQRSFAGGEISPEMFGRIDDVKFATGAARVRNFITLPHGPAANRPGFQFVREVKDSTKRTRLIPFTFSTTQTMVIELGAGYFRFHTAGGTVLSGASPYEITNPYAEADLFDIHFVQSADVLTLVHPGYAPRELRRLGATNWTLTTIAFVPDLAAPTSVTATANGAGSTTYTYKVTAVSSNGIDESPASTAASCTNDLLTTGRQNTISWTAVSGASRYNVYKEASGLYGYIGQAEGTSFVDDNIAADFGTTTPITNNPFSSTGNYPGAVSYFEQRRVFAGTINKPQNVWFTRSGTESNLAYSLPTRDDDAISFRVAAREANTIRHLVPLGDLVMLTGSGEWRVTSVNSDVLTPTTISVRTQSYIGANNVQPVIVNNNLIYAAARGGHVREMSYNDTAKGFVTGDLSLRAPHLFDGKTIVDAALAKSPTPVVWFVSSDGKLLGFTYVPEQQVGAWHWHDTDGTFESIAVVAEGDEDALYAVVRRTINGQSKRYVERLASRLFIDPEDAFFVDSGLTYTGTAVATITGLGHLEGKTVNILVNGAVHPQRVVSSGAVSLDIPLVDAEGNTYDVVVHVGLPITADLQTLPLAAGIDNAYGQGRAKNVNKAWLRVYRSSGIFIGPDEGNLTEAKQRTVENYGQPPALKSEEVQIMLTPSWREAGQVFIRQTDPLPLTAVSLTLEVAVGG